MKNSIVLIAPSLSDGADKNKSHSRVRYSDIRRLSSTLILIFLGYGITNGQKIDSLKSLLETKSGLERCDILYQLAYEYIDFDDELGLKYANQALTGAKVYGDSLRIVKAGRLKSLAYRRLGEMDSSMILSTEILPISLRHEYVDELKHILNGLALVYTYKANYDKALKLFFQSLELRERHGDKSEISVTLNNIGMVYFKLEDYDRALMYYKQSLVLKNEMQSQHDLDILLINISLCYCYQNNFTEARKFVDQALALCKIDCSSTLMMHSEFSIGLISLGQKNLLEAERRFLNSYRISKEIHNEHFQFDNIFYLSQIYIETNKIDKAKRLLDEGEQLILSGAHYNLGLIKLYSELFTFYKRIGDLEKVTIYQHKYIQLKDSIYSEELTKNLMRVEAEYIERENRTKIEAQNRVLSLKEDVILRQKFANMFIGITAGLLIILAIVLYRSIRQKRFANQLLEQKVEERTKELVINRDVLQKSLAERDVLVKKIATDIKNSLATIKGLCFIGLKDNEAHGAIKYINRIVTTSDNLLSILNRHL